MPGSNCANRAMVMLWQVTSRPSEALAFLLFFEPVSAPSSHFVRDDGSALVSFGFTAVRVYVLMGRSSVWVPSLKRSTISERSIGRSASMLTDTDERCGVRSPSATPGGALARSEE